MSHMVLQGRRPEGQERAGRVVPFECAVCRRGPGDGTSITASHSGLAVMLCDSHI